MRMIDALGSNSLNTTQDAQEQEKLLRSLRQVNEDDTLSRVLCADTRAAEDDSTFLGPQIDGNLNEEVTLCAASHAETKMAECISDGIEAADIGSLLEQFLEYEKGISPALSPAESPSFHDPTAEPSERKERDAKSNAKKAQAVRRKRHLSPPDDPCREIADLDMLVDNQVTISTTSEDDAVTSDSNCISTNVELEDCVASAGLNEKKQDCFIVSRNGVVVVEYRNVSAESDPEHNGRIEANGNPSKKTVNNHMEHVHVEKELVEQIVKSDSEVQKHEMLVDNESSNGNIADKCEEITCNGGQPPALNAELRSVIGNDFRISKSSKDSRNRARSRSPLKQRHRRSYDRLNSKSYCSSSDDDEEKECRFERYRSERRTPMRRDDRRKRRKYSSCSDDEYDYYRYSKRGKGGPFRDHSPRRSHNEHDYNKPRIHRKDFYRSSSVRERGEREHSHSRNSNKKEYNDYDDNVHERLSDLAAPVPYDIERERKIGFLVRESGTGSYERRNVYAGGIRRNMTRRDLIRRFECFGPVEKVTLHFREKGDNYAFVVFEDAKDAIRAVIDGNKDPNYEPLDLCFGGRRKFVGGSYVDFDANVSYLEENELTFSKPASPVEDLEFDTLLEMAKRQQSVE